MRVLFARVSSDEDSCCLALKSCMDRSVNEFAVKSERLEQALQVL